MAGFGEGLGALMQGFASMYAPRVEKSKDRQEQEKDRAERRADRAADRAERQADRAQQNENFLALLQERKDVRKDEKSERGLDRLARRDEFMMSNAFADNRVRTEAQNHIDALKKQYGFQKDLASDANRNALAMAQARDSRDLALHTMDAGERAKLQASTIQANQDAEQSRRSWEMKKYLGDRADKVFEHTLALQGADRESVAQNARFAMQLAITYAEKKEAMGQPVPEGFVRKYADSVADFIRTKINPKRAGSMTADQNDALGNILAMAAMGKDVPVDVMEKAMKGLTDQQQGLLNAYSPEEQTQAGTAGPDKQTPQSITREKLLGKGVPEESVDRLAAEQTPTTITINGEKVAFAPASGFSEKYAGRNTRDIAKELDAWGKSNTEYVQGLFGNWIDKYGAGKKGTQADFQEFQRWLVKEIVRRHEGMSGAQASPGYMFNEAMPKIAGFLEGKGYKESWFRPNRPEPVAPARSAPAPSGGTGGPSEGDERRVGR